MNNIKNILLADDETSLRKSMAFLLEKAGFNVIQCDNGVEAIMSTQNTLIDLALIDLKMRNIDGITAIESMYRLKPTLPVVVITAYADNTTLDKLPENVIEHFIKPFEVNNVIKFLNDYFAAHGNF
ncbi:MAG: hypothetical protein A2X42_04590 [Candidatus Margulisbacteria bacterium GWF2_38_17]|nr:MAG: hypothetical protein A2X43_11305 [Candidatus Margulisbacteria bacterium GWD2_39_127]OGI04165.1 MAG: hypothetical protein A2X42_04590 [Candidatus Margulisbacteria bacterium GWF2_38_17]OGI09301.1 MAG: hypothetical protein A2X41_09245 [Candidatus Margulisbacteria bacterium GWE2_39_32]